MRRPGSEPDAAIALDLAGVAVVVIVAAVAVRDRSPELIAGCGLGLLAGFALLLAYAVRVNRRARENARVALRRALADRRARDALIARERPGKRS